ncbi:hypothetical protein A2765_04440 [Candidatus Kaiserbacteria bacterium RIFCSPHIGHO2_01_FULL_56_24]|uniref:NodB homology domain-containing protein n=1 Tax=Candidatus Kaiserbacteria bacterium RIFCSPHIGHO2_01_FULL_56_24 TaxID=1798487 RepID=A0A1F6DEQ8_9BACT|nr:MAG: hypothetical protein A2765_04440 [Candidatus Kaiserbacteria bacterium RIFCSPHIGHO2_01_FULL_56_24]
MRILSVCHYYPPHVGGLEIVARDVAEGLAAAGHSVEVVTCATGDARAGSESSAGLVVHHVRALNILDRFFSLPFPLIGFGCALQLWRTSARADVIHVHDVFYMTSWMAYLCATLRGKPLVLTQHVGIVEHPSFLVAGVQRMVYATWGRWIFRSSHSVIVYNTIVKSFLLERGVAASRIFEMRHGVDRQLFRPAREGEKSELRRSFGLPDKPIALFAGRLVPKKGVAELLQARSDAYDIAFAGPGDIKPAWRHAGVHFLGPLSQEKLADAYRMADVFVSPSRGELFTLAMQEAAASGLPIVASDEPEYGGYDLDHDGLMLVDRTPEALKAALTRIISDHPLAARMSAYSSEIAGQRFDRGKNIAQATGFFYRFSRRHYVTTSWDDGHVLDLKLASLLKRYGVKGTLYISPFDRELAPEKRLSQRDVRALAKDFEIGAHTVTHPYLPHVDVSTARKEISGSKRILEEWIGTPVTSFCYPKGGFLPVHQEMVREEGFMRARTTERFVLTRGGDPFAFPTSIHTYDHWSDVWGVLKLARFNLIRFLRLYRRWDLQATALFDAFLEKGGVFHLWGHSWEVDAHHDWTRLENVLKYIANRAGVQYVANDALV